MQLNDSLNGCDFLDFLTNQPISEPDHLYHCFALTIAMARELRELQGYGTYTSWVEADPNSIYKSTLLPYRANRGLL